MPLPITTYAGREEAPAWSPDGRQVAFDWDGEQGDNRDIYVVDVASRTIRRLTTAPGADLFPAWSPDGAWIAYMHRDANQTSSLALISSDGATQRTLFTGAAREARASWFPDSQTLATEVPPVPGSVEAIWAFDVATGRRRQLTSPPPGIIGDQSPAVSPDGRSLAFSRKTAWRTAELYLVDLLPDTRVTGDARPLTKLGYAAEPAWTADGHHILFNALGEGAGIWQVDRTGGAARPVFGLPETASQPAVARRPDGQISLVFRNALTEYSIHRYSVDRSAPVTPTELAPSTRNQSYPRYSNDGRRLAFSSARTGHQEIWLANADGSMPTQLTALGHQLSEVGHWSPNDDFIAFVTQGRGSRELRMIAPAGGAPVMLTEQPGIEMGSGWSVDGRWYYYTRIENGIRDVWRVMRGTRLSERVTVNGGEGGFETDDGTFYYWRRDGPPGVTLMRRAPAGDHAVPLVPRGTSTPNMAARVGNALFYQAFGTDAIYRYDFGTRRSARVLDFAEPLWAFTISPDARWFAANFPKRSASDLMIVERFVY
jgi:Tol biopolymer transport system component